MEPGRGPRLDTTAVAELLLQELHPLPDVDPVVVMSRPPLARRLPALVRDYVKCPAGSRERLVCHLQGPEGCGRKTLAAGVCQEAGVPLDRVYPLAPTLEDLFMTYIRRGPPAP